jgi:photosystem II stability/assembly factor-like uncharacterized protein
MHRLALSVLVVACSSEPAGVRQWPADVVRDKVRVAEIAALKAQSDALTAQFDREHAKYRATTTTTKVATLVAGWNVVPITEYPTSFWGIWAEDNEVVAGGHQNWVVASSDGGASWRRLDTKALASAADKEPLISKVWGSGDHRVVIGFENDVVGVSHDRGATWTKVVLPIPDGPTEYADQPRALWGAGKDVYVSTEPGALGKQVSVFVSHDDGATWKVSLQLPATGTNNTFYAISGTRDGGEVYAAGYIGSKAGLYRTRDRGASWQVVHVPGDVDMAEAIAVVGPGELYAHFGIDDQGKNVRDHTIAHTRDGGQTWARMPVKYLGPAADIAGDNWWEPYEVAVAPDHTLYVSLHGRQTAMLESTRDGGKTWKLELADEQPQAIAFGAGNVYASVHDPALAILKAH